MTGGDGTLQRVRAERPAELLRTRQGGETTTDEELIPPRAVLIEEHDGLSRRPHAGPRPGRLNLHQRDQTVNLRLVRHELGQDTPQTQRVLAKPWSHPVVTGGRRVA